MNNFFEMPHTSSIMMKVSPMAMISSAYIHAKIIFVKNMYKNYIVMYLNLTGDNQKSAKTLKVNNSFIF